MRGIQEATQQPDSSPSTLHVGAAASSYPSPAPFSVPVWAFVSLPDVDCGSWQPRAIDWGPFARSSDFLARLPAVLAVDTRRAWYVDVSVI